MHSIHWQNVILLRFAPNALPNSSLPYHTRYPSSTTYTYKFTKFPHSHTDCLASTVTRRYHGKYCDSIWWSVYSNKMLATDTNVKCFGCYGYWHNFVVWPVNFRHNRQAKTCSVMSVFIPCGIANHHERRTTNDDDNKNVRVRLWVCVPCFGMRTLAENNNNNNKFEERENPSNKNITFQHFAEPREKFICHSPNNVSLFRSISLPHTLSVCAALFPRYSPPECLCMCVHSVSLSLSFSCTLLGRTRVSLRSTLACEYVTYTGICTGIGVVLLSTFFFGPQQERHSIRREQHNVKQITSQPENRGGETKTDVKSVRCCNVRTCVSLNRTKSTEIK